MSHCGVKNIDVCGEAPSGYFILGDGNFPLKNYIKIMENHDFDDYLSLGINNSIYWLDPHESIRKSVAYIHNELRI
jgi:protein FrlC